MRIGHRCAPRPTPGAVLLVLVALGACIAPRASAQINIEAQRRVPADLGYSGTLAADLELRTGNVEHFRLGVNGRVDYQTEATNTFLVGRGHLGLVGSNRFSNAGLLHLRHGWRWRPQVLPEVYAQINYDEPRQLDFRGLLGAGVRLGLADTESVRLSVGTGYMFEHERLDLPETASHPQTTSVHRWSSYLTGRVAAGRNMTVVATGYIQPQIDQLEDLRILSDLSLGVSVTRTLSLTVSFSLRYDSRPPDDVASLDTELRNGIAVAF